MPQQAVMNQFCSGVNDADQHLFHLPQLPALKHRR
jgi:hypothetical protein